MNFIRCTSYSTARKQFPSAVRICRVFGGFVAFATWNDYQTWKGTK